MKKGALIKGYGIMPNIILFDKKLTSTSKLIYCLISSLCAEKGYCFASNKYLSEKMSISETSISKNLSLLEPYLSFTNRNSDKRRIYLEDINLVKNDKVPCQKLQGNLVKNDKHNNINNNNINNNSFPDGKVKEKKSTSLEVPDPNLKHSAPDSEKPHTATPDDVSTENGINVPPDPQIPHTPQNLASGSVPAETFDQKKEIKKLVEGYVDKNGVLQKPKPSMVIIGLLIMAQGIQLESKEQLSSIIKRNLRSAKLLEPYNIQRIITVMKYLHDNVNYKWGLETVSKYIDYDLEKIKPINNKETLVL